MKKSKLIDFESELTESDIEKIEELDREYQEQEKPINEPVLTETVEIKHSVIDAFVWEVLEGSDSFKRHVSKYVHENMKLVFEGSDLSYFDWSFHQYLRDAFIDYSRSVLEDVKSNSENIDLEVFVKLGDLENLTFMDIFNTITAKNGNKNFGKFILEKN